METFYKTTLPGLGDMYVAGIVGPMDYKDLRING